MRLLSDKAPRHVTAPTHTPYLVHRVAGQRRDGLGRPCCRAGEAGGGSRGGWPLSPGAPLICAPWYLILQHVIPGVFPSQKPSEPLEAWRWRWPSNESRHVSLAKASGRTSGGVQTLCLGGAPRAEAGFTVFPGLQA